MKYVNGKNKTKMPGRFYVRTKVVHGINESSYIDIRNLSLVMLLIFTYRYYGLSIAAKI